MLPPSSTRIASLLALILGLGALAGCASVSSTAVYYTPSTVKIYPPKLKNAPIPILDKAPPERFVKIGRLAFESDQGWPFMRESILYNARQNGADAAILKKVSTRKQVYFNEVPPQVDWVPVSNYYQYCRNGRRNGGWNTTYVPYFRPGYIQRFEDRIIAIDADMIVLKK